MVTLLAIEQLTGTIRVPAVTINTQGSTDVSRSISEMRAEIEKIDARINTFEEKKSGGITPKQIDVLDKQIKSLNDDKNAITKGIENARGLVAGGSTTSIAIANTSELTVRPDKEINLVSDAVKEIVITVLKLDDAGAYCFAYIHDHPESTAPLAKLCEKHVNDTALDNRKNSLKDDAVKKWIDTSNSISDDIIKMILKLKKEEGTENKMPINEKSDDATQRHK